MIEKHPTIRFTLLMVLLAMVLSSAGCRVMHDDSYVVPREAPRELDKTILPTYTIEPPDILTIEAVHVVPKAPYRLRAYDVLAIRVKGTLPDSSIDGLYPIEPGGTVNLGFTYGTVKVSEQTVDEAALTIQEHLQQYLKEPQVVVNVAELAAKQQIAGEHLVAPDGTVTLGSYGNVQVVGLTIPEAKRVIEEHLAQYLDAPEVSVDVFAYNSKVYYVITQGAGMGDGVFRFPVTGNETILDAISQINGLDQVSSKRIWIARAGCDAEGCDRVFPVDWNGITQCGRSDTNYQIFPGDRVYIAEDKLVALDTSLAKIIAPLERVMGFSLLGAGTVTRFSGPVLRGGGNRQSTF
ncbi:MAG: polysaccharide biosynthesis/export family protein [Pirellulales bacterium]|nr:polysaccharide biosynthesis/export family protein [Pirellulales bacterium]